MITPSIWINSPYDSRRKRLVEASALLARQPQTIRNHPLAQRLPRDLDAILREQNLGRETRTKVCVT
jgi:hypothetical protein